MSDPLKNQNIINEEPQAEEDLNSSYIDEDEFGYEYQDRDFRTTINEIRTDPFTGRRVGEVPPIINQPQEQPQPQEEPEVPVEADYREEMPQNGVVPTDHLQYGLLRKAVSSVKEPTFSDPDDVIFYNRYVTALDLLSQNGENIQAVQPVRLRIDDQVEETSMTVELTSRQQAWNIVHGPGNLDRILGMQVGGGTVAEKIDRFNNPEHEKNAVQGAIGFIRQRENAPFPQNAPRKQGEGDQFEGLRLYDNAADFAANFGQPSYEDARTLTRPAINEELQTIEQNAREANDGNFDPAQLTPQQRDRYEYLSGLRTYFNAAEEEGALRGAGNNVTVHDMYRLMGRRERETLYLKKIGDPQFAAGIRAVNQLAYRAMLDPSLDEIDAHAGEYRNSPEGRRLDLSKPESFIAGNEGYANLLGMQRFFEIMGQQIGMGNAGVTKNTPAAQAFLAYSKNPNFDRVCLQHAQDPLFRKGIQAVRTIAENTVGGNVRRDTLRVTTDKDAMMNTDLFTRTLAPVTADQLQTINEGMQLGGDVEKLANAVETNQKKQTVLAKMMFMANLSHLELRQAQPDGSVDVSPYGGTIGNLFAHGDKVEFRLPTGDEEAQKQMADSVLGANRGSDGTTYRKNFTRRHLATSEYNANKQMTVNGGTAKSFFPGLARNNFKMDLAVGGLGSKDPEGRPILADGSSGNAYIKTAYGDEENGGGILFGIDASKPGKASRYGTSKDAVKNRKAPSAFLAAKGGIGDEENGRIADLHRIPAESFTNLMKRFDQYYTKLQKEALYDPAKAAELEAVNRDLAGKPLGRDAMKAFLTEKLGIEEQQAGKVFLEARKDEDQIQTEQMVPVIPPPENPNADKSPQQIEQEKQQERYRLENMLQEKLYRSERELNVAQVSLDAGDAPANANQQPVTLAAFLHRCAGQLRRTNFVKTQDKLICTMAAAIVAAQGDNDNIVDPSKLDYKKIARIPSIEYQLKYDRAGILDAARDPSPKGIMLGSARMSRQLAAKPEANQQSINALKRLYAEMNVPNLKNRSEEYQKMVKVIGKVSMKSNLNGEDKLMVINAVKNYASKKSTIPHSNSGKLSLDNAYKALETVLPSYEARQTFKQPLQDNIYQLRNAMEEQNLEHPQPQAQEAPQPQQQVQNNGPQA